VTLLRPMSVAVLLALAPTPLTAADASPQPPPYPSPVGAQVSRPLPDRAAPVRSVVTAGETPAFTGEGGERSSLPSPLAAQPLDRLSVTRERPLFSPTRRPPPPPPPVVVAPEPPPPPPPPPDVALFGIVMDGDEAQAVVRAGPAAKIMRVRVGDDIGGWKVAQIEGRQLVLSLDDRIATFMMFAGNGANSASPVDRETQSADRQSPTQTQPQNQLRQNAPPPPDPPPSGARRPHRPR
jgi:general secretion pathway protein N